MAAVIKNAFNVGSPNRVANRRRRRRCHHHRRGQLDSVATVVGPHAVFKDGPESPGGTGGHRCAPLKLTPLLSIKLCMYGMFAWRLFHAGGGDSAAHYRMIVFLFRSWSNFWKFAAAAEDFLKQRVGETKVPLLPNAPGPNLLLHL